MQSLLQRHNLARLTGVACLAFLMAAGCGEDDGLDGDTVMVEESEAADECDHGGTVFTSGYDETGDGEIDDVVDEYAVCEGAPGADGEDGASGDDGTDALVETSSVEPGSECDFGGVRVDSGVDETGDGELSEDEIEDTQYVCNTQCATGEPLDFDVQTDELPDRLAEGYTYQVPVESDLDSVAFEGFDPAGDVEVDFWYDADEDEMVIDHVEGDGTADLTLIVTDGCDIGVQTLRLGPYETGWVDLHVANMLPDVDDVDFVAVEETEDDGDDDNGDDNDEIVLTETAEMHDVFHTEVEWGEYDFEIRDEEGDVLVSMADELVEPFSEHLFIAYEDDEDVEFVQRSVDSSELDDDDFRLRTNHLAEDGGEFDAYLDGGDDAELLLDGLEFGDMTDAEEFVADDEAILGLDTSDDGEVDIDFMTSSGLFGDGTNYELFFVDVGNSVWAVTYEYDDAEVSIHDPDLVAYPSDPDLIIEDGGTYGSDTITVSDCDTIYSIDMDFELYHSTYFTQITVYLENPAGDEYALWSEGDSSTTPTGDGIVGNFNGDIEADAGTTAYEPDVEEIDVFEGSGGNGDWTATVYNDSGLYDAEFDHWQLNLSCVDDDDNGDDDNGDDDNGDDDNGDDDNGDDDNGDNGDE